MSARRTTAARFAVRECATVTVAFPGRLLQQHRGHRFADNIRPPDNHDFFPRRIEAVKFEQLDDAVRRAG